MESPPVQLTIDPDLLALSPLTKRPEVVDGDSLEDWAVITDEDGKRDRKQLTLLIGAEKQRQHGQDQINEAALEKAIKARETIDKINATEVKTEPSWWRKFSPF